MKLLHYGPPGQEKPAILDAGGAPGVGLGMKPERYLNSGDTMRLGIKGLGVQHQHVH